MEAQHPPEHCRGDGSLHGPGTGRVCVRGKPEPAARVPSILYDSPPPGARRGVFLWALWVGPVWTVVGPDLRRGFPPGPGRGIQAFSRESPDAKSRGGMPPAPPFLGPARSHSLVFAWWGAVFRSMGYYGAHVRALIWDAFSGRAAQPRGFPLGGSCHRR